MVVMFPAGLDNAMTASRPAMADVLVTPMLPLGMHALVSYMSSMPPEHGIAAVGMCVCGWVVARRVSKNWWKNAMGGWNKENQAFLSSSPLLASTSTYLLTW